MCGHCKHTGCWLFLCIIMLLSIASIEGNSITPKNLPINTEMKLPTANTTDSHKAFDVSSNVWIGSVVSVIVISAVGLLGVAVVPLVHTTYYPQVIQFLVALAVGSLTGDAFLHLLPHSIAGGHQHEMARTTTPNAAEEGPESVLKGLVALIGVYFFFLSERLVGTISEYRAEKKAEEEEIKRILLNPRKSQVGLRRLSTFRESISVRGSFRRSSGLPLPLDQQPCQRRSCVGSLIATDILTSGLTARAMKTVDVLNAYAEESEEDDQMEVNADGSMTLQVPTQLPNVPTATTESSESEPSSPSKKGKHGHKHSSKHAHVTLKDAEDEHVDTTIVVPQHHHGHAHQKVLDDFENVPGSMASVALMVIMGDGLHNFTDGMAIGVAFTAGVAGGISTAIAVFCHELPHELGDFAVLLKTGMKIKDALIFNVVSSILCFIGMIVGVGVGNIKSANGWVFALTAGIFIYIALVDMLPELNSFQLKPDQSRIVQMLIQNSGLIVGAGIMLLIALYEEDLLHLISDK